MLCEKCQCEIIVCRKCSKQIDCVRKVGVMFTIGQPYTLEIIGKRVDMCTDCENELKKTIKNAYIEFVGS